MMALGGGGRGFAGGTQHLATPCVHEDDNLMDQKTALPKENVRVFVPLT